MDLNIFPLPQPIIASGIEIGLLAVGVILSAVAGLVLTPKLGRNALTRNNTAPVLAERGSYIPRLIGTMRLGCVFAWAGKPRSKTATSGGFLGFGTTKTKITSQAGWHIICIGPVKRLIRIYQQGKIIFPIAGESILDSTTTHNGSLITLKSGAGAFRIYWGDGSTYPPDALLSSTGVHTKEGININSMWPQVCYVVWQFKKLDTPNQWPELNYEVEARPTDAFSAYVGTGWNDGSLISGTQFRQNNGAKPAAAIVDIMCSPYPQGVGIPIANLDNGFFSAAASALSVEGLLANVVCLDGNKASSLVNDILSDIGGIIPQVGDKIILILIRKETSIPVFTTDALIPPLPEMVFVQGDQPTNRVTYVYKDRQLAYRDNDVTVDDDSVQQGRMQSVQTALNSVIDLDIANIVTDRKQMENLVNVRTYTVTANRQARALSPGQVFSTSALGQVRIVSVQRPDQSSSIVLECVADIYSPIAGAGGGGTREVAIAGVDIGLNSVRPVYPDAQLFMWVVPYDLVPPGSDFADCWVQFLPIRSTIYTEQENVMVSFDTGLSPIYNLLTVNSAFFIQGLLTTLVTASAYWDFVFPISSDTYQVEINIQNFTCTDDTGALIAATDLDFDVGLFPDLTNYPERWRNGENCCAIENQAGKVCEIFYFKSITVSPNAHCYYLNGVLRNRIIKNLNPNEQYSGRVVLFRKRDLDPVKIPNPTSLASWSLTNTLKAQSNAIGVDGALQLEPGKATVQQQLYTSLSPLPPANFRSADADTNSARYSWAAGANLVFKWTNRPLIQGVGSSCGTQLAGIAISGTAIPFEGTLTIKIYDNSVNLNLKRTFTITTGVTQTYTNAQLVTDFGAVVAGFSSCYVTYQVDLNGILGSLFGQTFSAR